MPHNFAQGVTWDLSDLYASIDDPRILDDLKEAETKALAFEAKYKPLFQSPGPNEHLPLAELLADYKTIASLMTKPGVFAQLAFSGNTSDARIGAFMQKIDVRLTDIGTHLVFFEVSWNRLDAASAARYLDDPSVREDRHFLEKMRLYAPYTLAEGEEKIMAIKSNTSGGAFRRLFDETMNNIPFYVATPEGRVKKTEGEVLSLLHSADRRERKMAFDSLAEGLEPHTRLLTYIYNMVLADHRASMKIRGYHHPMDSMNLSNEISLDSVRSLMQSVKKAYPTAMRYYRLKRRLLGLDKLYDYDRYATLEAGETKITFDECRSIVLDGYRAFSPEAGGIIEPFFSKRWIDAEVREGKQGGGFCCPTTPELHPYILVNFTGSLRDVMTVAHELGHGLHQWLSRRAGVLESSAPLTLAETASVFGEMLIFEKILSREKDPKQKLALLCGKIDDNFATVFRQIAMTDFEQNAHQTGLAEGELSSEAFSELWMRSNTELYGDSVELTPAYRHGWKYIPHFVHTPFYCYAYAFAQLFVLSLFERYKEEGAAFLPKYFEMLSLGGSRRPESIAAIAGLDINAPGFWERGLAALARLVDEAETLAGAVR